MPHRRNADLRRSLGNEAHFARSKVARNWEGVRLDLDIGKGQSEELNVCLINFKKFTNSLLCSKKGLKMTCEIHTI